MEVEPPAGDATALAAAAAAESEPEDTSYVAPSEEQPDALLPAADGIVMSDRVLGYYGDADRDVRTAEQRSAGQELGLKWGEYYVPDDMLDQLTDDGDDTSEESDEDLEIMEEEEEAEEEAVYEDAMTCLGMKMVGDEDAVVGDETIARASFGRKVDVPVTDAGAAASLDRLPETVLQKIFLYTFCSKSEPCHALPLERVCKAMHWALRPEGKFWDLLAPRFVFDHISTMRERGMWTVGLRKIRKYQKSDDNLILSVLEEYEEGNAADNFRYVAASVMAKMMKSGRSRRPLPNAQMGTPRLRGDTVGYLAELLQARAIKRLEEALLMALHAQREQIVVTRDDILKLDKLRMAPSFGHGRMPPCNVGMKQHHSIPNFCSCSCTSSSGIQWCWPEDDCLVDEILPAEARRKIVRRLAYRAGIVKLTSEVFDLVAAEMLHSLGVLLVDAFEVSREAYPLGEKIQLITSTDQSLVYGVPCDIHGSIDMFSTPPPPLPASEDSNNPYESGYAYTIVPGQIKNSALKRFFGQGGPYHVLGDTWVAGCGFTCEEEMEREESYYFRENIEVPPPSRLQILEAERNELANCLAIYGCDTLGM